MKARCEKTITAMPPGFKTRCISLKTLSGSVRYCTLRAMVTKSKESSCQGRRWSRFRFWTCRSVACVFASSSLELSPCTTTLALVINSSGKCDTQEEHRSSTAKSGGAVEKRLRYTPVMRSMEDSSRWFTKRGSAYMAASSLSSMRSKSLGPKGHDSGAQPCCAVMARLTGAFGFASRSQIFSPRGPGTDMPVNFAFSTTCRSSCSHSCGSLLPPASRPLPETRSRRRKCGTSPTFWDSVS
mmetsp:Transcript_23902/g.60844  ORF Transcript_23902/g.60844 Transcript_23902/m.60844 type:complete len:241 (-) Transcript_23902:1313-2035(-)